jgi:hypothetical protein
MKAYFLFTAGGPLVMLTSYDSIENQELLKKLDSKGISKFIAHEVSVEQTKAKYGMHFDLVLQDLHQSDDMRILDYSGERAFRNFKLSELGPAIYHETNGNSISHDLEHIAMSTPR